MRLLGKIETFLNLTLKGFGIVMQANMTTTNNNDQRVRIQNRGIRDQLGLLQYKLEPRCLLFIMTMAKKFGRSDAVFPTLNFLHQDIRISSATKSQKPTPQYR